MTQTQIIWAALIGSTFIINVPLIGFVRYLFIAGKIEMVLSQFQPVLDHLSSLVGPITTLKANADAAITVQDVQDTVTALQTAVNAIATASGQPTQ